MAESLTLPVLPLDDTVLLPGMVVPIRMAGTDGTEVRAAVEAAQAVAEGEKPRVVMVPRLDGKYARVGVLGVVEQVGRLPGGELAAVVRGTDRVRIGAGTTGPGAALWVEVEVADAAAGDRPHAGAGQGVQGAGHHHAPAAWRVAGRRLGAVRGRPVGARRHGRLRAVPDRRAEDLAAGDGRRRPSGWRSCSSGPASTSPSWTSRRPSARTSRKAWRSQQREFLLRQQLSAIRKELAELDGKPESEEQDYRARVEAADLPEKVREAALAEVDKLERTSEQSPEVGWIRTWLDTVLEMPWNTRTDDAYDIAGAREILDADHAGLDDVKDRIIEYLAVRKRRDERGLGVVGGRRSGAVLALAGPPGVGKTSLGESVARAMGRKFVRVALGGIRDEAEIRGHRRTYVGALPGRIVRAISEAGSMNPVVLLDEIDKVGSDYRGDPTAALLEVLDPAQNHTFRDHYLEVELDLSDVVFLATANVIDSIPAPLLDRMELVTLDGYTEDEKVVIARDHLLPRQLERAGLAADEVTLTDDALRLMAGEYTREAGVRQLERSIARVLRKITASLALDRRSSCR